MSPKLWLVPSPGEKRIRVALNDLKRRGRWRELREVSGIDFSSNDYLALSHDPRLTGSITDAIARGVGSGSGGSRLLRGNHPLHQQLESRAARFFGAQRCLFFANGFMANYALFSTLPQPDDLVLCDQLIHASVHDGTRAGKARVEFARHNDSDHFEQIMSAWRGQGHKGCIWIAIESLYSMDGDFAPIGQLVELASRYDAYLVADEAHATGVFGQQGKGLCADYEGLDNLITLHTCGKALGAEGALLCLNRTLADYLVNKARAFIYSTAPSPLMACAVLESLRIIANDSTLQRSLQELIAVAQQRLGQLGLPFGPSQIQPVILNDAAKTMAVAAALQNSGFDVRGIRPPSVPENSSRLRISITLNVNRRQLDDMFNALEQQLEAAAC